MEKKTIGSFISALRRAAGMTQRDLAEQLNVSDKAVSRWERDESAPDLTLLPVIADLFDITVDELLRGQRKPVAENPPQTENADGEEMIASPTASSTKRQKMLFGNRLRKQKMLNYIPLGLFATGVIAALLCNSAFYRAALGFFLGLLFEVAAVICALAFGSAAMPVSEENYDATLLQEYKRGVIRTAYLPIYLATLTLPMLMSLLFYGAFVGAANCELLLPLLATLIWALLLREVARYGVLPAVARRYGVVESEQEAEHRAGVKHLAKRCALFVVGGLVLPVIAMVVLTCCGAIDSEIAFVAGRAFDTFDEFSAHMPAKGEYTVLSTTDFDTESVPAREALLFYPLEETEYSANDLNLRTLRYVYDAYGQMILRVEWRDDEIAEVVWQFDQENVALPITVYTYGDCIDSHSLYDALWLALGMIICAVPVGGAVVYAVKKRKI